MAVGAASLALVFLVVLVLPRHELAASNSRVIASAGTVPVAGGSQRCQGGEYVPADARRLRIYPGGLRVDGPPLVISVLDRSGHLGSRVSVPGGYRVAVSGLSAGAPLDIPLPGGRPDIQLGQLCIRNAGVTPVYFAGNLHTLNPATPGASNGPGERGGDEVRADYFLAGTRSGLQMAGRVASRAALFRPGFMGAWTVWLVLGLLLATCGAALVWTVRHLEEQE